MAIHTGITPTQWADEGEQAIATAVELIAGRDQPQQETGKEAPDGWELRSE